MSITVNKCVAAEEERGGDGEEQEDAREDETEVEQVLRSTVPYHTAQHNTAL